MPPETATPTRSPGRNNSPRRMWANTCSASSCTETCYSSGQVAEPPGRSDWVAENVNLHDLGIGELRVRNEPAYQRDSFSGFSFFAAFPKNCVGKESFSGKIRTETIGNRPPIVTNWRSILFGKLLPSRYDVSPGFIQFTALFLCPLVRSSLSRSLVHLPGFVSVMRLTAASPNQYSAPDRGNDQYRILRSTSAESKN